MKLQLVLACLGLIVCVWLAEAVGSPKGKKPPPPKGKTEIKPSPKVEHIAKTVVKTPVSKKYHEHVAKASKEWKAEPAQKAAVNKLLAGQEPLTEQERQQVSDLLFNAKEAGLSRDDEEALSYLMLDEAARSASVATSSPASEERTGPWFVQVYNKTDEPLKVWIQVIAEGDAKNGKEADAPKRKPLQYDLAKGKRYDLQQNGDRIKASVIRVWAISPTRSWAEHRDHDLVLTTPTTKETYMVTFSK